MSGQTEISNYFLSRKKFGVQRKHVSNCEDILQKPETPVLKTNKANIENAISVMKKRKRSPPSVTTTSVSKKTRGKSSKPTKRENTLDAFVASKLQPSIVTEKPSPKKIAGGNSNLKVVTLSPSRGALLLQASQERTSTKSTLDEHVVAPVKKCLFQDEDEEKVVGEKHRDVKTQLLKSEKLGELKLGLELLKEKRKELSELKNSKPPESPKIKHFHNLEIMSPQKGQVNVTASLVKNQNASTNLLATITSCPESPSKSSVPLTLPFKYRYLEEVFRSVDQIVSLMHNRKERVTFEKLKPSVQQMMKRNFTEHHFGQIMEVYPSAFKLSQEKCKVSLNSCKYQLIITPNLQQADGLELKQMDSITLLKRRNVFHDNLLNITKQAHQKYLEDLDIPVNIPLAHITRWHQEFPLDDVQDIKSANLPKPPSVETFSTAKDVLEKSKELSLSCPRMKEALEKAKLLPQKGEHSKPVIEKPNLSSKLKGINSSLLERIRKKEAEKLRTELTRNPASEKRMDQLEKLPDLIRILRSVFVGERKGALTIDLVIKKLTDSNKFGLNKVETQSHLELMMEELPKWVTKHKLSSGVYIKLDKKADLNKIILTLENKLKEERNK